MSKKIMAATLVLGLLLCATGVLLAQEGASEEDGEFSWGTVNSISSNQIVLSEYNYDSEEELAITYTVDPDVKLYNVGSFQDIAVGDDIWVDYVIREGQRVAKAIEVKTQSPEESLPSEIYEEESEYSAEEEEVEY